jgi:hypothetical protein
MSLETQSSSCCPVVYIFKNLTEFDFIGYDSVYYFDVKPQYIPCFHSCYILHPNGYCILTLKCRTFKLSQSEQDGFYLSIYCCCCCAFKRPLPFGLYNNVKFCIINDLVNKMHIIKGFS